MSDDDEWAGFSPSCEQCLVQLDPVQLRDVAAWHCSTCGLAKL